MSQPVQPKRRYTVDEYFQIEAASPDKKYEYHDGYLVDLRALNEADAVVAMAGASEAHIDIVAGLTTSLRLRLRGKACKVYPNELRIAAADASRYFYPDVAVVCGPIDYEQRGPATGTCRNPKVIIEVLSSSTERADRGYKCQSYIQLDSLNQYLLVSQEEHVVQSFQRQEDGTWLFSFAQGLEASVKLPSLNVELPLAEVYEGVTLNTREP